MFPFPPPFDSVVLVVSLLLAIVIVFGLWLIVSFLVVQYANGKVNRHLDGDDVAQRHDTSETMNFVYWLSVLFWPVALILGVKYMKKPETARAGRICLLILLGTFNGCVALAPVLVVILLYFFPPGV